MNILGDKYMIDRFYHCQKKAEKLSLDITIPAGDFFELQNKETHLTLGKFMTINDLFNFLCGYEWGKNEKETT